MTGNKGDTAAKIIVIILIAAFLGTAAYSMLKGNSASPGAMPYGAAGRSAGGQVPPGGPGQAGAQTAGAQGGQPGAPGGPGQAGVPGNQGGQNRSSQPAANAITVSAKIMERESIQQVIKLNGDVSSQSAVSVFPETSGKIIRILKNLGDTVRQGDIIAYVDPSRPGAAYIESPVISPVAGTITSLPVTGGLTVSPSTVIAVIGSLDKLKITIYVAEKYSAYLRQNLPAYVSFMASPEMEYNAWVSSVSPVVNSKNRTIETTLNLASQDLRIKEGMFAAVRLVIREERNTLVIPRSAIKDYNGEDTVYIIDGENTARRVPVTVGLTNDSDAQILSGLNPGDRVITAGAVTEGSPVRIAAASL
ncbi:MAG: efflux RND transporter periplasmic adaptor subunit [Treponema sp.]|jgi:multidrug efflux pump subunit AcrA (membrane-fusion protein)|nr:efflux RND transporter periplasmic adaptor subunit [Treponema sp.]